MDVLFFIKGLVLGLSIAAVVGPMAILCISRTLQHGYRYGLVSGLGVAAADATYGSIAAFGLTLVSTFLIHQQLWIRLIGGLFLLYLGVKAIRSRPTERAASIQSSNLLTACTSTYLLTLTNPMTILSFVAIFAGIGLGTATGDYLAALAVVAGVFSGSALWWICLCGAISLLKTKLPASVLHWMNVASGLVIIAFALWIMLQLFR